MESTSTFGPGPNFELRKGVFSSCNVSLSQTNPSNRRSSTGCPSESEMNEIVAREISIFLDDLFEIEPISVWMYRCG